MGNFEGMAAVVSVFGNAPLSRLKPLWGALPSKVCVWVGVGVGVGVGVYVFVCICMYVLLVLTVFSLNKL